jgi:hypothetical protein
MANTCYTCYLIEGNEQDLKEVYNVFNTFRHVCIAPENTDINPKGYGVRWLGNILSALGIDPDVCHCNGEWETMDLTNTDLFISTATEWEPCHDLFRAIKYIFPALNIYWCAESVDSQYFATNDIQHTYFKDKWYTDFIYPVSYTADDENKVLQIIERLYQLKFSSVQEAIKSHSPLFFISEYIVINDGLITVQS